MSVLRAPALLAEAARVYREAAQHVDRTWLYAIQAGHSGPIKLGLAKKPWERLLTLQTANADELRGIAAWRVYPVEEKHLHEDFAYARIRGEWFRPVPELVETVLAMGCDFCDWEKPT